MGLEAYFDPAAWRKFHQIMRREFESLPATVAESLDGLNIPQDIKEVLIARLGADARNWLFGKIPALGGERPIDLLADGARADAVRESLMRMKE